jgi:hypothetical protein
MVTERAFKTLMVLKALSLMKIEKTILFEE